MAGPTQTEHTRLEREHRVLTLPILCQNKRDTACCKHANNTCRNVCCRASVQQSLKELGVDALDLVLLHWPEAWLPGSDPNGEVHPDNTVTLLQAW